MPKSTKDVRAVHRINIRHGYNIRPSLAVFPGVAYVLEKDLLGRRRLRLCAW